MTHWWGRGCPKKIIGAIRPREIVAAASLCVGAFLWVANASPAVADHETARPAAPPAPNRVIAFHQSPGGVVRWILPGPRRLDPTLFGTPQNPLRTTPDIGVPLGNRLISSDGRQFTTTLGPTPFSDFFAPIGGGFEAVLIDRTAADVAPSQDQALFRAFFTGPNGVHHYRVELTQLIPVGHAHRFFGGVMIDGPLHGATGNGTALQPTLHSIGSFWGIANLFIDDRLIANNRMIHFMATQRVRSPDADGYSLLWDNELGRAHGLHVHMLLPDMIVTPAGGMDKSPVPSGLITPTGMRQPFIHLMFENVRVNELRPGAAPAR